jgi:hypothetical protein
MRKFLAVAAFVALLASLSFAQSNASGATYVLTEDENTTANTASVFSLNTTTGVTTEVKKLSTGGTGLGGGFFAGTTITITSNNSCIFVADTGSNDIASFAAPKYAKVANYSNSALNWSDSDAGGSLALSPDGKWLYGAYSGSENIGAWAVGAGCKLTFINSYVPSTGADLFATLHVTPDGKALIVPSIDLEVVTMFSIDATNGDLTEVNNVSFSGISDCADDGCYPYGFDISGDSKVAFFGDPTTANDGLFLLACNINTTTGVSNPTFFTLTSSAGAGNSSFPWFTKAAYAKGTGTLYIGMAGYFDPIEGAGVVVGKVNETPGFKEVGSTLFNTPNSSCDGCAGTLESHGNLAVSAQLPDLINVYTVDATTGAFTLLKSNTDANATALLSLHVVPETR